MNFKRDKDRREWGLDSLSCDKAANARLRELVALIDQFSRLAGWGPITITSYYRPGDKDSYHHILQAVDIRTKDKPPEFKAYISALGSVLHEIDPTLQILPHKELYGTIHEPFHIAIKDGKIKRN